MTGHKIDTDELAQVCWCDTNVRYVSPAVVRAGEGWSCAPDCQPGCKPGAGHRHRGGKRKGEA